MKTDVEGFMMKSVALFLGGLAIVSLLAMLGAQIFNWKELEVNSQLTSKRITSNHELGVARLNADVQKHSLDLAFSEKELESKEKMHHERLNLIAQLDKDTLPLLLLSEQ